MSSWLWNPPAKARIELIGFRSLSGTTGRTSCPLSSEDSWMPWSLWWAPVLFALHEKHEAMQTQAAINWDKLQSSNANRKIVCLQMRVSISDVFLSKQVTYEFNVTVHSARHDDIFCKHGALREPSCTNTCFVCKITYSSFWRNHSVCGSSASLL